MRGQFRGRLKEGADTPRLCSEIPSLLRGRGGVKDRTAGVGAQFELADVKNVGEAELDGEDRVLSEFAESIFKFPFIYHEDLTTEGNTVHNVRFVIHVGGDLRCGQCDVVRARPAGFGGHGDSNYWIPMVNEPPRHDDAWPTAHLFSSASIREAYPKNLALVDRIIFIERHPRIPRSLATR